MLLPDPRQHRRLALKIRDVFQRTPEHGFFFAADGMLDGQRLRRRMILHPIEGFGRKGRFLFPMLRNQDRSFAGVAGSRGFLNDSTCWRRRRYLPTSRI
jgi:hypothetical protein